MVIVVGQRVARKAGLFAAITDVLLAHHSSVAESVMRRKWQGLFSIVLCLLVELLPTLPRHLPRSI